MMPAGRLSLRCHSAAPGRRDGCTLPWEITYGACWCGTSRRCRRSTSVYRLADHSAIVVLLSLEIAATLVLFGAQVIAQYERAERRELGMREARQMLSRRPAGGVWSRPKQETTQ